MTSQTPQLWTGACLVGMTYLDGIGTPWHSQAIALTLGVLWFMHCVDCQLWLWLHAVPGPRHAAILHHLKEEQGLKFIRTFSSARKFLAAVIPKVIGIFAVRAIVSASGDEAFNNLLEISNSWISALLYVEFLHGTWRVSDE